MKKLAKRVSTGERIYQKIALRITFLYGIIGIVWILVSDKILYLLSNDITMYRVLQNYKGTFFVIVTTVFLYFIIGKQLKLVADSSKKMENSLEELRKTHKELAKIKEKLDILAYTDIITALPNKLYIEQEVNMNIKLEQNKKFALVYIDIDNFKNINDTLGHSAGDQLLRHIAKALRDELKYPHLVGRLGGDEFVLVVYENGIKEGLLGHINGILEKLKKPWVYQDKEYFISISAGIALYPQHGKTFETLYKNADSSMYMAKEGGRNKVFIYSNEMQEKRVATMELANQLHNALNKGEFVLHYQPIMDLKNEVITGLEALIRWQHPQKGLISPVEFIPIAENTGLIHQINLWVLKTACLQKKQWDANSPYPLKLSINFSCKSFEYPDLADEIQKILDQTQTNPAEIQLEITETTFLKNIELGTEIIKKLREKGISIALDDFGTGYSSLTYLINLPIDVVKLDRDFIKYIGERTENEIIVKAVVQLAQALGIKVVAEGIESKEQLYFLKSIGCDECQGYYFSKPYPPYVIEEQIKILSS
ncbi:putative bifunctional diguanylate cyclase/phosphodiesterase [Anaerobranca gottschalkii]|uniref:Diguanylate cyclase (GGDEF) domain-containing protein n=1 Tax=Anaerobranca gottschalkii DSM 13577 TaxID=1120990 RepID=A0A1I0C5P4_9FIRM|nr:EAL domain-containing protein [Anaerobranca gottschalkii]SET14801.1 diguanylate cyclase (GGDEF) domain-containing protein [Anaerobranca gottschalkii DSM 13577]